MATPEERLSAALYTKLWNHTDALAEKALAEDPDSAMGIYAKGLMKLRTREFREGELLFKKALGIDPVHQSARLGLASCYHVEGRFQQAEELAMEVLSENPGFIECHVFVCWLLAKSRQIEKARAAVTDLRALDPRNPDAIEVEFYLRRCVEKRQDNELLCHELLALDPNNFLAHLGLGEVYFLQNDFERAEEHIRIALAMKPNPEAERMLRIIEYRRNWWGYCPLLFLVIKLKLRRLFFGREIRRRGREPKFDR